jgi:hypothetical protein
MSVYQEKGHPTAHVVLAPMGVRINGSQVCQLAMITGRRCLPEPGARSTTALPATRFAQGSWAGPLRLPVRALRQLHPPGCRAALMARWRRCTVAQVLVQSDRYRAEKRVASFADMRTRAAKGPYPLFASASTGSVHTLAPRCRRHRARGSRLGPPHQAERLEHLAHAQRPHLPFHVYRWSMTVFS